MCLSSSSSCFIPNPNLKGVFVGSGSDGLQQPIFTNAILSLTEKAPSEVQVLYIGTASYDGNRHRERQTSRFVEAGCHVASMDVTLHAPTHAEMRQKVQAAHVVIVSGGNTLYAVDRWKRLGLDGILQEAMERGVVLAGGSAGAICWFTGGHSDSADPDTFAPAMRKAAASIEVEDSTTSTASTTSSTTIPPDVAPMDATPSSWEYLRVGGLGFLPGLLCPHHDVVQSNGVLRALDFESMLLRHAGEVGIGMDHWAALEVECGRFRVISMEGKPGSVSPTQTFCRDRTGVPGIWIMRVEDGKVKRTLCPKEGELRDLLRIPKEIVEDKRVDACRRENPDIGPVPVDA